ncbi:SRPBCC family protein [Nocardiopsis sp. NPDC058631]|uniref:SRPBCC family protein n=1 Tax=Nocardiopsis sp. NPDC058631 TaxID=3346566 RepID=UPI00364A8CA9
MAYVRTQVTIDAGAEEVWSVVSDFASGPVRMAPGFVTSSRAEGGDVREVVFADGTVVRERLVSSDGESRRIAYAVVGGVDGLAHDNASMTVVPEGEDGCRLVWSRDVLPDGLAPVMERNMEEGLRVIGRALGRSRT